MKHNSNLTPTRSHLIYLSLQLTLKCPTTKAIHIHSLFTSKPIPAKLSVLHFLIAAKKHIILENDNLPANQHPMPHKNETNPWQNVPIGDTQNQQKTDTPRILGHSPEPYSPQTFSTTNPLHYGVKDTSGPEPKTPHKSSQSCHHFCPPPNHPIHRTQTTARAKVQTRVRPNPAA